jgi:hypothetical protein
MENFDTVYILANEGMPGLCKIGYTSRNDIQERAKELYTTGVPYPFEVYYACQVKDGKKVETTLHKIYQKNRVNPNREFFEIDPEIVKLTLSLASPDEITPDETEYMTNEEVQIIEKRKRLHNYTFSELEIPYGSTLHFSKDNNITCNVHSDNTVMFDGKIITLTEAARYTGHITHKEIQGPRFWLYENELLTSRRKRIQGI